jgi:hypothetical protein
LSGRAFLAVAQAAIFVPWRLPRRARRQSTVGFEQGGIDQIAKQVLAVASRIHHQPSIDRADAPRPSAGALEPDDDVVASGGKLQRVGLESGGGLLHLLPCLAGWREGRQQRAVAPSFFENGSVNNLLRSISHFWIRFARNDDVEREEVSKNYIKSI